MATETFRTVAIDETEHWGEDVLADNHIAKAFGLYLFREGEATYCCDTSPSTWCEALQNVFIFDFDIDPVARAKFIDEHPELCQSNYGDGMIETDPCERFRSMVFDSGLEYEAMGQDSDCYISFIRVDSYDARFLSEPIDFDVDEDEHGSGGDGKMNSESTTYAKAAWDEAREYVSGNSVEPKILWPEVYVEYLADEQAKKRSLNEAPVAGREPLPLFINAYGRMKCAELAELIGKGWLGSYNENWLRTHQHEYDEMDSARGVA